MPELTPHQESLLQEEMRRIEAERERAAEVARQQEQGIEGMVTQIQLARKDVENAVTRLHELCQQLRSESRKMVGGEGAHHYMVFTNAHIRLAGALAQGIRRATSVDRVLYAAKAEQVETKRRDEQERQYREARSKQQEVDRLQLPQDDDFEDLYGDVVTDA